VGVSPPAIFRFSVSRLQLLRQFLVESLLLCVAGAGIGVYLARAALSALARPADLPSWMRIALDQKILLVTVTVTLLCALIFGLMPLFQGAGANLRQRLDARGTTVARQRHRHLLVTTEVALAVILLAGAGLMLRSLWQLRGIDPGFETERFFTLRLDPAETDEGYADPAKRVALYDQIRQSVSALSGVEAVAFGQQVALGDEVWGTEIKVEGAKDDGLGHPVRFMTVGRDYFHSLSIPLARGRFFTGSDHADAMPAVIINQRLARQVWGDVDPIGARVDLFGTWRTVVGVAADVKQVGLDEPAPPTLFRPLEQSPQIVSMVLFVRTSGPPASHVGAVRSAIWEVEPLLPISQIRSLDQVVEQSIVVPRLLAQLLGAFAATLVSASVSSAP
jgi:putative ABC transport system permease protein